MKPRLLFILPQQRPPYEIEMITRFRRFDPSILWYARDGLKVLGRSLPWRRILSVESLEHFFVRRFGNRITNAKLIVTLELHSPESYLVSKCFPELQHVVLVWETLKNHPFYLVPPIGLQSRYISKSADHFIAFTRRSAAHLMSLGIDTSKISVIYPGIDLTKFRPAYDRKRSGKVRFLYSGVLERHKGVDILLQAFKRTNEPNFELTITGRGSLETMVRSVVANDDRIKFLGWLPQQERQYVFRESDVFCCPSLDARFFFWKYWEEQFGFSLVEAMGSGLPIVSTNCGAISEVVGSRNLIVPQGSVTSMALALDTIGGDEGLRCQLGGENRSRAEDLFDVENQSRHLENAMIRLSAH